MRALFLLFITIPVIEMWVLIEVGSIIGSLSTILLVLLTATIGLALLRQQGVNTLFKLGQRFEKGELPATEILEGVMLAVGGALLLTPGFITDAFGFACLIPHSRQYLVSKLLRHSVVIASYGGSAGFATPFDRASADSDSTPGERDFASSKPTRQSGREPPGPAAANNKRDSDIIDGEYRRDD